MRLLLLRILLLGILAASLWAAPPGPSVGTLNGAAYRIDMPERWNGVLVVYCHGYAGSPGRYNDGPPNPILKGFLDKGYAVVQSGYSAGGWAIEEGIRDTEALREHFIKLHGKPKETYITGHSMGGFLTMMAMEMHPQHYDAGLPLCGPLAAANWFMERRAFDGLVLFNYLFPGTLPDIDQLTIVNEKELAGKIQTALAANPASAEAMRRWAGIRTMAEVPRTFAFSVNVVAELLKRTGGLPFDNRDTVYEGIGDDNAVNDGVKRYTANPKAAEYLRKFYTPTGKITKPMLAIHTTYDVIVPPSVPNMYTTLVEQAGTQNLFVQNYVKRDGHCTMTSDEVMRGFERLREWKVTGKRPAGGALN